MCNFPNAVFFCTLLPETAKVPLEDMDTLWENAPWFVPTLESKDYLAGLKQREMEISKKQSVIVDHKD